MEKVKESGLDRSPVFPVKTLVCDSAFPFCYTDIHILGGRYFLLLNELLFIPMVLVALDCW